MFYENFSCHKFARQHSQGSSSESFPFVLNYIQTDKNPKGLGWWKHVRLGRRVYTRVRVLSKCGRSLAPMLENGKGSYPYRSKPEVVSHSPPIDSTKKNWIHQKEKRKKLTERGENKYNWITLITQQFPLHPKIYYMLKKFTGGNKRFNIFNWKTSYPFEFWTDQIIEQNKL